MNRALWRSHPSRSVFVFKWFAMTASTSMLWFGAVSFLMAAGQVGNPHVLLSCGWLFPAFFVAFGPFGDRASEFATLLPVSSRRLWTVHVVTVTVLSLLLLVACFAPLTWLIGMLAARTAERPEQSVLLAAQLPRFWSHGVAWLLTLVALTATQRPDLARVPRTRAWYGRQLTFVLGATAGMFGIGALTGVSAAALVALASLAWLGLSWRRVPAALALWPQEAVAGTRRTAAAPLADRLAWRRRLPLWAIIHLGAAKHEAMHLFSIPFVLLVGMWLSDWPAVVLEAGLVGVVFVPITAYMLFTMAATPLFRLSRFDWLPISRDRLLVILFLPLIVLLALGDLSGQWIAERQGPRTEALVFSGDPDTYGVRMPAEYFKLAWGEPPAVTTPSGRRIDPPDTWRPTLLPQVVLYKPYHTPLGTSLDDCAWQLERASRDIYGQAVPAAVFRDRYLTVDPAGVVVPRQTDGLTLQRDLPDLKPRRHPGLPAVQVMLVAFYTQLSYLILLLFYRPGRSEAARKRAYGSLLGVLMAIHIGQFLTSRDSIGSIWKVSTHGVGAERLAVASGSGALAPGRADGSRRAASILPCGKSSAPKSGPSSAGGRPAGRALG
ncbi:MAG: hypothetical protein R3D98_04350 [Candidatus Krumholzibacteriia bacterium]